MNPKTRSAIIAIKAVGKAPAKISAPPSVAFVPRMIISPKPPAPTNEPIAVIPIATTSALRIPAIITAKDRGNSTIVNNCHLVIPIPRPESRIFGETLIIPVYVFLIIGNNEYKKTAIITVLVPKPKPSMMIDNIANDGTV